MAKGTRRRSPVQERALRRRDGILEATARLLSRIGFEGTNTNAVAAEAGASVGTVYQYFPNKESLFLALLERYRARLERVIDEALRFDEDADLRLIIERVVDAFAHFYESEPGYRVLWLSSQMVDALAVTSQDWGNSFGERIGDRMRPFAPHLSRKRRVLIARVSTHLVSALVTMALTGAKANKAAVVAEAKTALGAYLATVLGSPVGTFTMGK